MSILWRPAMAVGHEMIDEDHQGLVDLINAAEGSLRGPAGEAALTATLDQLTLYAKEHFDREESLMASLRYGRLAEHRLAHRDLRTRLVKIRAHIEAAKSEAANSEEIDALVELLRSWLLTHVLKEDMLLKPILKS